MARLIDAIAGHDAPWARIGGLIERGRLAHALALTGPSGIGKRLFAWALAQRLACARGAAPDAADVPCGTCPACRRVEAHQSEAVLYVEPSGTQIKLEAASAILSFLSLARITPARVVIVDDAHLLNPQAANALLKIVEEPPEGTYFLFVVPELSRWLPTLRSRSQVIRLAPLNNGVLAAARTAPAPEEWMLKAARGSLGRLAEFGGAAGGDDLRGLALGLACGSVRGDRGALDRVLAATKERPAALKAVRFLQRTLRDWCVLGEADPFNVDQVGELNALGDVPRAGRVELWRASFRMESDLLGFVDRNLVFEDFYQRGARVLD